MFKIYQISDGETLETIANKLNLDINELRKINGIGLNMNLVPGTFIIIPDNSYMYNSMNNDLNNYMNYTIKKGDTLYELSQKYNTDVNTLLQMNGLEQDDYIYPGETLMIPNMQNNIYVTKKGDTLNTLEEGTKKSIEELNKNNMIYVEENQIIKF